MDDVQAFLYLDPDYTGANTPEPTLIDFDPQEIEQAMQDVFGTVEEKYNEIIEIAEKHGIDTSDS